MDLSNIEFAPRKGPEGLGGWLVLPILGLALTAVLAFKSLVVDLAPAYSGDMWAALTTPGAPAYDSHWAPYLILSTVAATIMLIAPIALLVLALGKRHIFPVGMILFYLFSVLACGIDLWALGTFLPQVAPGDITELTGDIIRTSARAVVACLIWIPYFTSSKRVANTFVRPS